MLEPIFSFYTKPEYYADIIKRLESVGPGDRVVSITMVFQPADTDVKPVIAAFISAAKHGADVTLIVDAFNYLSKSPGTTPSFLAARYPNSSGWLDRADLVALKELAAAGGRYCVLNLPDRPITSPVMGRSHIKFTLINDLVYLGGCNLESLDRIDMMVSCQDSPLSDWLWSLVGRMMSTRNSKIAIPERDTKFELSPNATVFLDAGHRGRSQILATALDFIDSASKHLLITCQFFPGQITASHLLAAYKRGVKVTIVYNHPTKHDWPGNLLHYVAGESERRRLPKSFFSGALRRGPDYLHAKLIASERGAMVGSHNFVQAGVTFGTAEIGLLVLDSKFSQTAIQTVLKQVDLPESAEISSYSLN